MYTKPTFNVTICGSDYHVRCPEYDIHTINESCDAALNEATWELVTIG